MDDLNLITILKDAVKYETFARLKHYLSLEGYNVPYSFITLLDETTSYYKAKSLIMEILTDPTGLTAAMYGIKLEDE